MSPRLVFWFVTILIALQILDVASTIYVCSILGIEAEANPIARYMIDIGGWWLLCFVKLAACLIIALIAPRHLTKKGFHLILWWALMALYVAVIVNNFCVAILATTLL